MDFMQCKKRLYDSVQWRRMRARQLAKHPLCDMCLRRELYVPATVVDHIIPHRNKRALFSDPGNLQSLCEPCHNSRKKMIERHGYSQACDVDGLPLDPGHGWYRGGKEKALKGKYGKII